MALNTSRATFSSSLRSLRQCSCPRTLQPALPARPFSQSSVTRSDEPPASGPPAERSQPQDYRPRWSYTPERMKGPGFSINIVKDPRRKIWSVNTDPKRLDAMYERFLGPGGDRLLPDEVKWLAVTHKSFDQGRRGFNTRLAYFGRQILSYEATRSILVDPRNKFECPPDQHRREPFRHPALANVDKLVVTQPQTIVSVDRIAQLAVEIGLPEVTRWKPKMPENLHGSGLAVVLNTSLFAILGAVSLQQGAEVAAKIAREKILKRLQA